MIANTDTKHYLDLTDAVYRFMPSVLTPEDTKRIHGFNERLGVKNYEKTINYFYHLMRNADAAVIETEEPHSELWGEESRTIFCRFWNFLDGTSHRWWNITRNFIMARLNLMADNGKPFRENKQASKQTKNTVVRKKYIVVLQVLQSITNVFHFLGKKSGKTSTWDQSMSRDISATARMNQCVAIGTSEELCIVIVTPRLVVFKRYRDIFFK